MHVSGRDLRKIDPAIHFKGCSVKAAQPHPDIEMRASCGARSGVAP
jgi:hypothetical protein